MTPSIFMSSRRAPIPRQGPRQPIQGHRLRLDEVAHAPGCARRFQFLPELYRIHRLLNTLRPDLLHNLALKPSIIGSLAIRDHKVKVVNSLTGLGFVFYATSLLARAAQRLCALVLRRAVARNDAQVVVLNTSDAAELIEKRMAVPARNIHLLSAAPGSI